MKFDADNRSIICEAIDFFGEDNQVDKAIEEMAELTKALLKNRHEKSSCNYNNVNEEIADVAIMLEQLIMIFDTAEIVKFVDIKLNRLNVRIANQSQGGTR